MVASVTPITSAPTAYPASNAKPQADESQPQNAPRAQNVQAGSSDERIRNLERQIKGLGPISFSGDVRVRAEPFFGGPADHSLDRARARIRARFRIRSPILVPSSARASLRPRARSTIPPRPTRT